MKGISFLVSSEVREDVLHFFCWEQGSKQFMEWDRGTPNVFWERGKHCLLPTALCNNMLKMTASKPHHGITSLIHINKLLKLHASWYNRSVKSVCVRSFSIPYFLAFGLNKGICFGHFRIQSGWGKNTDPKISEYEHFLRSVYHLIWIHQGQ